MTGRDGTADGPADVAQTPTAYGEMPPDQAGFSHTALLYHGSDADLGWATAIVRRAAETAAPLHVVVPSQTMRLVREALQQIPRKAILADMTELGRNPARIIPAAQSFGEEHPGEHVCCLWEPAWPARSSAELLEVARHEALCNLAFRGREMTIVCLYDTSRLPADVISSAERTHPAVIAAGRQRPSPAYLGPGQFPPGCDEPLPPPDPDAAFVTFDGHLGAVREFSASQARAAGLESTRAGDLVLAVSELAANAIGHAGGGGVVRSWCTSEEMLCQVEDYGHIADPLAGRRRQHADAPGGHGLWLVNRVCDLVERRTDPAGTITRLHMRLGAATA
ncbi:MAG TPA: sensor histidine kinase [Streptosporangiaceae bacterium]|nr:sensor histidine kinase [Streptosporangiaceae bacterium]